MGIGGAGAIIVALLRSRHACCTAADEPPPVVLVSLPLRASLSIAQGACSYTSPAPVVLEAVARPGREAGTCSGKREGLERRKKEVRKSWRRV